MKKFAVVALVGALLAFVCILAHASTVRMFDTRGVLIYECERIGDATVFPDGRTVISCGPNMLALPGGIAFLSSPLTLDYTQVVQVPLVRKGGTQGLITATLVVAGPCSVTGTSVMFLDSTSSPRDPPTVRALSGVHSGVCSLELHTDYPADLTSLTTIVTDSACRVR